MTSLCYGTISGHGAGKKNILEVMFVLLFYLPDIEDYSQTKNIYFKLFFELLFSFETFC